MKLLARLFLCLFVFFSLSISAQNQDEQICLEIVKNFYSAYQAKDLPNLKAFWSLESRHLVGFEAETTKFFSENQTISIKDLQFINSEFKDEMLRIRVKITINEKPQNITFQFVRENNQWFIWGIPVSELEIGQQIGDANTDEERIEILNKNLHVQNILLCRVLLDMQIFRFRNAGDTQSIFKMIDIAQVLAEKTNDNRCLGIVIYRRAAYNQSPLNGYYETLEFAKKNSDLELEAKASYQIGMFHIFNSHNRELGEKFLDKSLKISELINFQDIVIQIINFRALGEKDLNKRLFQFQNLMAFFQKNNYKSGIATTYGNLANCHWQLGNQKAGFDNLFESLRIFTEINDFANVLTVYNTFTEYYSNINNYEESLVWAEKAHQLSRKLNGFPSTIGLSFQYLNNLKKGNLNEAKKAAQTIVKIAEDNVAKTYFDEYNQSRVIQQSWVGYHSLIEVSVKLGEIEEAFKTAELFKSRVLYNVLKTGKPNISKSLTEQEKVKFTTLRQSVNDANRQLTREKQKEYQKKSVIENLEKQLTQARQNLEEFQFKLYAAKPELKIHRGNFQPINLDEISALIPDEKTAILEFAIARDDTFIFSFTKENGKLKFDVHSVDLIKAELIKKVEIFRQKLQNKDLDYQTEARELYRLIFSKVENKLKGKENLLIVPDDFLWELPFQALITNENRFLIEDLAIKFAPSLTVLREMNKKQRPFSTSPKLLAFGNPELNPDAKAKITKENDRATLDPLPSAEKEVDFLGKIYGAKNSTIVKNQKATETFFKSEAAKFNILHFATHGTLNNEKPMYSAVVLSLANDQKEDGLLEAWELMELNLNADLVILSACDTARGKVSLGEGMIGLSWAFFIAGTPRVVASQWQVDSISTADFMKNFHQNLMNSASKSIEKSLQRAMIKQLKNSQTRHPLYWAGFISIGKQ